MEAVRQVILVFYPGQIKLLTIIDQKGWQNE